MDTYKNITTHQGQTVQYSTTKSKYDKNPCIPQVISFPTEPQIALFAGMGKDDRVFANDWMTSNELIPKMKRL
jgi:hypothetical protein